MAVILSIGKDNAPVNSKARFEPGKPDQNVMAAEYHALFLGVNMAHDAVSILNHSGFPQNEPIIFQIDSQTCINLANAEHIPPKSKHNILLEIRFRVNLLLYLNQNICVLIYLSNITQKQNLVSPKTFY